MYINCVYITYPFHVQQSAIIIETQTEKARNISY